MRALVQHIELLILDEPTSVLTPQEVQQLFKTLKTLADEGCSILLISHKLDDVVELCTAATVLRHGKVTGHCNPQHTTSAELARMMVGNDTPLSENYAKAQGGELALHVENLCYRPHDPFGVTLQNLSLQVKAGEILGIAGVAGNGQDELMGLLSGEEQQDSGSIHLHGQAIEKLSPDQRRQLGFAFVPEERLGRGAVPDMSLVDNARLSASHRQLKRKGWIQYDAVRTFARDIIDRYNVCLLYPYDAADE